MSASPRVRRGLLPGPLGELTLVADGDALTGVYFPAHRVQPQRAEQGELVAVSDDEVFAEAARQLEEYFDGSRTAFDLPLAPTSGNELDPRVWQVLRGLGFGQRVTYGEIARELGNPRMAQAVGGAVGRNPLGIVVPCHRVVGANGKLAGFAGGEGRKQWLLQHEAFVAGHSLVAPQPV